MKILITGTTGESMPPPYGGVPKLSLLCAGVWQKQGHEVAVTFVYKPEMADDLGAGATYFFEYHKPPTKVAKLLFLLKYLLSNPFLYRELFKSYWDIFPYLTLETILYPAYGVYINSVIEDFKPDLILSEAALIKTFMVAKVAKKLSLPVVFDTYAEIHDLSMGVNKILDEVARNQYWKTFLSLANLVITPGPYCCRGPKTYLPPEKVSFVYDGSDYHLSNIKISNQRDDLRNELGLPRDLFLIGNTGAFESRKGHDHLIIAISKLVRNGHKVGAVICGGSGNSTKWKKLAKSEGVEDYIFFFDQLSEYDLAKVYKSLDAFSDLENTPRACGFTMALLEGMAMSLPVIIYDNREMLAIVKDGENGFVVPVDDIDVLAQNILKLKQLPPEVRQNMGEKSAALAQPININFTANKKMELFQQII